MQQGSGAPDLNEIASRYREMNEAALMDVARGYDSLVPEVQDLLRAEFANRNLEPPLIEDVPELRQLATVNRYRDLAEASMAQSVLESAGIEAFLRDANIVRNDWFWSNMIGGLRLEVDAKDLEAAREILAQPIPESIATENWTVYKQPYCPNCRSLDVSFEKVDQRAKLAALALVAFPIPGVSVNRWKCATCGAMWTDDGETEAGTQPPLVG